MREEERENLLKTVNRVSGLDVLSQCRERPYVNARIVYSYILFKRGHSYTDIARTINRNHSTIIHYMRNAEWLIKNEDELNMLHEACLDIHSKGYGDEEVTEADLLKKIVEKDKEIEQLSLRIQQLTSQLKQKRDEEERFAPMFAFLRNRVPLGREEELTSKFNRVINGL